MKKEDFIIQSEVRRMLIRSNIDYSRIDYGTVKGVVYFRGFFRLPMAPEAHEEAKKTMTVKTLLSFEKKVRSIPGVVDVLFQFNNWRKERGQWIPTRSLRPEEKGKETGEGKRESEREEKGERQDEDQTAPGVRGDSEGD